jgi:hypothetical protein
MAKLSLGNNRRKKGPNKFVIIFLIIILIAIGFLGVKFYSINGAIENKLISLTYTISYEDEIYFIRVLKEKRKVYIVKAENNSTFTNNFQTFDNQNLKEATDIFLRQFSIASERNYYINLSTMMKEEIIHKLKGNRMDIEGFFDALKYRNSSFLDFFQLNNILKTIEKYDRETNLTLGALNVFLKGFSNYAITDYRTLDLKGYFDEPVIVKTHDGLTIERNYIDNEIFEYIKRIVE